MRSRRGILAAAAFLLAAVAACTPAQAPAPPEPEPVRPQWREVSLPHPPGEVARVIVRDAVRCGDRWYLSGAVADRRGDTRPAAWSSGDGVSWQVMATDPHTFWGRVQVLYSVACKDGRLAALGAKSGGAHAYPRTSSWRQRPDGVLEDVIAGWELFGGPRAVNVARLVSGPGGYLITGNRAAGAAVWLSPDAREFRIVEGAPELSSDDRGNTWNFDATATDGGWLMVGGLIAPGRIDRDPLAWRSADGERWTRVPAPGSAEYDEFQRVTVAGGSAYAVGLTGPVFGAWRLVGERWEPAGTFGGTRGGGGAAQVRAAVAAGDRVLAAVSDGSRFTLWRSASGDRWRQVEAPVPMPAGADRAVSAVSDGRRVVLLTDDGANGRVWVAEWDPGVD
ncbi:hypothetical protein [Catellatospora sp. NPDC049609]|uniref:hypothetical protein n=1 Tax=Catellatospora sp. NPDC049609 TaxID=3155505 RepID=UPI00341B6E87